ncbi:uncharacterized protein DSM5745_07759 [Aspergillus mulundensis]|uniref:Uncharacterized protein n=1 Tax=Aspergillus mulundensis TaxID=1810919 RepID=A0A3D8REW4_9EURO|nr:hypothetical protein DSM5745_07759 [Aspergillus mulundensis]RDW72587.1 hypothetical protein DSM5745_07759 [Aspergillus mulundensis]
MSLTLAIVRRIITLAERRGRISRQAAEEIRAKTKQEADKANQALPSVPASSLTMTEVEKIFGIKMAQWDKMLDIHWKKMGESPRVEPVSRTRLDIIMLLVGAYLEQNGLCPTLGKKLYLQAETQAEWPITHKMKKKMLRGRFDYSFWYQEAQTLANNLFIIEAKPETCTGGETQLLAYMGMVLAARQKQHKANTVLFGLLTDSWSFCFYWMNKEGKYRRYLLSWKGGENEQDMILGLLGRCMLHAAVVSPEGTDNADGQPMDIDTMLG